MLASLCLLPTPALAALDRASLDDVAFTPPPGAHLPLDLPARENGRRIALRDVTDGRPTLLVPVDFTCKVTCGPVMAIVTAALAKSGLSPGADYRLLLVGIDPHATVQDAESFASRSGATDSVLPATHALVLDEDGLARVETALGYRARYDAQTKSFAHPIGAVTLTSGGSVTRFLSPLALDAQDLRLALLEAGQGKIGSWTSRVALLCYGFDAAHGVYTSRVTLALRIGGALVVTAIGGWLALMFRAGRANGSAS